MKIQRNYRLTIPKKLRINMGSFRELKFVLLRSLGYFICKKYVGLNQEVGR
jgi:bifunctional DNA-binding transcriptional regulator/antitoxin component of YhaV-PrlF toxin-antitoxin module